MDLYVVIWVFSKMNVASEYRRQWLMNGALLLDKTKSIVQSILSTLLFVFSVWSIYTYIYTRLKRTTANLGYFPHICLCALYPVLSLYQHYFQHYSYNPSKSQIYINMMSWFKPLASCGSLMPLAPQPLHPSTASALDQTSLGMGWHQHLEQFLQKEQTG